jgi:hypothetical protein
MTFINQVSSGESNEYLYLEPSGSPVPYSFLWDNAYGGVGYITCLMNGDWAETYKTTNMDAVYEKNSISYVLKPNRKVLVEVQFYPNYFDSVGISGKYVKLRVGLCNTNLTENNQYTRFKSDLLSSTVYTMENNAVMGETGNTSSVYKAIISHSESVDKTLCFFVDSSSSTNISTTSTTYIKDAASKIKITQLD